MFTVKGGLKKRLIYYLIMWFFTSQTGVNEDKTDVSLPLSFIVNNESWNHRNCGSEQHDWERDRPAVYAEFAAAAQLELGLN